MKNTFFLLCTFLLLSASTYAQKKKKSPSREIDIPENVNTSFKSQFAVASDNHWNKSYSGNYVANFLNADSLKQTAEFDRSGAIIKTKINYSPEALPQHVTDALAINYANAKVTECAKMQLPGIPPYYRIKITTPENTQKEVLINEEGTVTE